MKEFSVYESPFQNKKPKIQKSIICKHCKSESGWTNNDLVKIPTDKYIELKCRNMFCKKTCIVIKPKDIDLEKEFEQDKIYFNKLKNQSQKYENQG